jgi:hypothetical protein
MERMLAGAGYTIQAALQANSNTMYPRVLGYKEGVQDLWERQPRRVDEHRPRS